MIEVKTAERSHTLHRDYLYRLFREATRQGKTARLVVRFGRDESPLVLDATITRTRDRTTEE